jgi:hypothetical protein
MSQTAQFMKLESELKAYTKILGQAADVILDEQVSKYPIFIAHQQELEMGIPLIHRNGKNMPWSVNASTLEEFVTKGVVFEDKLKDFKDNYKNPEAFICLFVLSELGAQFIYLPR